MSEVEEFLFGIPDCEPGDLLRIKAPDGVILKIPLPESLRPGDALRMHKPPGSDWTVKSVSRGAVLHQLDTSSPPRPPVACAGPPSPVATSGLRTAADLASEAAAQAAVAEAAAAEAEAAAAAVAQQAATARCLAAEQRAVEQRALAEQQRRLADMQMQGIPDQQRAMQEALGADPCHQRAAASTPPHPKNLRQKPRREIAADLASPDVVTVQLYTTKGPILVRVVPSWAPLGVARFLDLIDDGYYSEIAIYRAVPGFLVQFGIIKDPQRSSRYERIRDDPLVGVPVEEGSVVFAASGPNTRKATICIFLADYPELGHSPWETPLGKVSAESLQTLHDIFTGYGDIPQCGGAGPDPIKLEDLGNSYITSNFPESDFVIGASRVLRELAHGWLECLHSEGVFYYNQDTLRASVEIPDELVGLVQPTSIQDQCALNGVQAEEEQTSVVKMQLGDWMVCEDAQGEFYWHVPSQQSFDNPPPELVRLYDQSLLEEERRLQNLREAEAQLQDERQDRERRVQEQLIQLRIEQEKLLERQMDQTRSQGGYPGAPRMQRNAAGLLGTQSILSGKGAMQHMSG
mmetsp:Transcript_33377/g.74387  ORF Transcript_33377/g.74387 Transcript_33377/m.74387 type:complete len:575 (+) Transcript_33377:122-1846(+)